MESRVPGLKTIAAALSMALLAACGAPIDSTPWSGGGPEAGSCEGRGGQQVESASLCRFEADLRYQAIFFRVFEGAPAPRLTPSSSDTAWPVQARVRPGDRIVWTAHGAIGDAVDGTCGAWRTLAGAQAGVTQLNEGMAQGLLLSVGQELTLLGNSATITASAEGDLAVGVNSASDTPSCWQIWPTKFSLLHCESLATGETVPCP